MMESIIKKIGMSLEEYSRRLHEHAKKILYEDDNPIPGIPDMSVLTMEEINFATQYITEHGL